MKSPRVKYRGLDRAYENKLKNRRSGESKHKTKEKGCPIERILRRSGILKPIVQGRVESENAPRRPSIGLHTTLQYTDFAGINMVGREKVKSKYLASALLNV